MKLAKIYLKAFGPYTEKWLDLENPAGSLHLFYGPNEAGKSSFLRAVQALLFGFPEQTSDNFLHDYATMRLGAELVDRNGRRFAFLRRKGKSKILSSWNGQPGEGEGTLPEEQLREFLAGLDKTRFTHFFSLDGEQLKKGGDDILAGKGEIGQSLFEAGSGLLGLRTLLKKLEEEASALFSPRGTVLPINQGLTTFKETQKQVKEGQVKPDEWNTRQESVLKARHELKTVGERLLELRQQRERLQRIAGNLPLLGRRQQRLLELEALADVPELPENSPQQRIEALTRLDGATTKGQQARTKIAELTAALESLAQPIHLVGQGEEIEGLYRRLSEYRRVVRERPLKENQREGMLADVARSLREIDPTLAVGAEQLEPLRPRRETTIRLRRLVAEHIRLSAETTEQQRQVQEKNGALAQAQQRLAAGVPLRDPLPLELAIDGAASQVAGEGPLAERQAALIRRQHRLAEEVAGLWPADLAAWRALALPGPATLERFAAAEAAEQKERQQIVVQIRSRQEELATIDQEKSRLESGAGPLPTEAELEQARQHRDEGWRRIRWSYVERRDDPARLAVEYDPDLPLPEAFSLSIREADQRVDRIRHNSELCARLESLRQREEQVSQLLAREEEALVHLDEGIARRQQAWRELTAPTGVELATVREFNEWFQRRKGLLSEADEQEREADLLASALAEKERAMADLRRSLGESADILTTPALLLTMARRELATIRQQQQEREAAQREVERLHNEVALLNSGGEQSREKWQKWRQEWQALMESMGLAGEASPEEAQQRLAGLEELFHRWEQAEQLGREIKAFRLVEESFAHEVRHCAATGLPDLTGEPDGLAEQLYQRYRLAVQEEERRQGWQRQLTAERLQAEQAEGEEVQCRDLLQRLCQQAACDRVEDLPRREEAAERRREVLSEWRQIEEDLVQRNGVALDRVLEEAASVVADGLAVEKSALEEELRRLEAQQLEQVRELREKELFLARLDGGDQAAAASQKGQEVLARLRGEVESHVDLKLAALLLRRSMDLYRERSQGPILQRAGDYFRTLTAHHFSGLESRFDDKDQPILVGVRADGKRLKVGGMSAGTCDQLHLSLRLSAIEHHLAFHGPVPVLVDDLLISFDDARSRATLQALAELSGRTQILLFTHHAHVAAMAREVHFPAGGGLVEHRLESGGGRR